jgi:hypothetical protein
MSKSVLKRSLCMSLIHIGCLSAVACDAPDRSQANATELFSIGSLIKSAPIPMPKSADDLAAVGGLFRANLAKKIVSLSPGGVARSIFTGVLIATIVEVKGLPRSQLVSVLKGVLADDAALCSGASCGRVFGISGGGVESYLDEVAATLPKLGDNVSSKDIEILAGSLRKDEVAFTSEAIQEAIRRELGIYDRQFTRQDLVQVKKITLREGKFSPYDLNDRDLKMIPHVTMEVRYRSEAYLETVINKTKMISSFAIKHIETHHSLEFNRYVELEKIGFLRKAKHIKSLTLMALNLDATASFESLPPSLKHLEIEQLGGELTDGKVQLFNQPSSLKSVSLRMEFAKLTAGPQAAFKRDIRSVKFFDKNESPSPCGDLSKLAVFRHAAFMTLGGCTIDALRPSQAFEWEALYLAKPSKAKEGQGGKVELGDTLHHLKIVKSEDPSAIDLDAVSRSKVEARARTSKDLENGRIIDAIVSADPGCAAAKPQGTVIDRILACMRPK